VANNAMIGIREMAEENVSQRNEMAKTRVKRSIGGGGESLKAESEENQRRENGISLASESQRLQTLAKKIWPRDELSNNGWHRLSEYRNVQLYRRGSMPLK
jgi:hypothetical protein